MAAVVPDTEDFDIAALAIAWDIVKEAGKIEGVSGLPADKVKKVTDMVLTTYEALKSGETEGD